MEADGPRLATAVDRRMAFLLAFPDMLEQRPEQRFRMRYAAHTLPLTQWTEQRQKITQQGTPRAKLQPAMQYPQPQRYNTSALAARHFRGDIGDAKRQAGAL